MFLKIDEDTIKLQKVTCSV